MNISPLFSTPKRELLLCRLLSRPSETLNMNGLARELKISPGQVHKYAGILQKEGLFESRGGKLADSPNTRALRVVCNLKRAESGRVVQILRRYFPNAAGIGVFGSWVKGTNNEGSDFDVWIKIENEPEDLLVARARRELERSLGVPADITIATPSRVSGFKEKSGSFYFSLFSGITLWGAEL